MNKFWEQVMPVCVADFSWGKDMSTLDSEGKWDKPLRNALSGLDDDEFNLFLAKVVIKASGAGVVGVDLTEKVTLLKSMRAGK